MFLSFLRVATLRSPFRGLAEHFTFRLTDFCADFRRPTADQVDDDKLPEGFSYIAKSMLVGDAKSFKPRLDYPSSTFETFEGGTF